MQWWVVTKKHFLCRDLLMYNLLCVSLYSIYLSCYVLLAVVIYCLEELSQSADTATVCTMQASVIVNVNCLSIHVLYVRMYFFVIRHIIVFCQACHDRFFTASKITCITCGAIKDCPPPLHHPCINSAAARCGRDIVAWRWINISVSR